MKIHYIFELLITINLHNILAIPTIYTTKLLTIYIKHVISILKYKNKCKMINTTSERQMYVDIKLWTAYKNRKKHKKHFLIIIKL